MSRAGRKRKNGPRHPGGQLKKDKKARKAAELTENQPHRHQLRVELRRGGLNDGEAMAFSRGEEAESPIGRLWAAGRLALPNDFDEQSSRDRYDAGSMFAQIVGAYRSAIEAPQSGGGSGRGFGCLDLLCRLAPEHCECARRKERYDRAFETLTKLSRRSLMAVNKVAVHREPIGEEDIVYLVAGLEELRRIFGLTDRRKRKQYRNAK